MPTPHHDHPSVARAGFGCEPVRPGQLHSSFFLATIAVAAIVLLSLAGCQTPNGAGTVPPPATGMIGQPAQYGGWATQPMGAAYPASPSPPPMPGPATQWQGAAAAAPQPNTSWSWSQPAAPQGQPYQQTMQNQAQQFANQAQAAPQQYANQAQQFANQQQQQLANQAQATVNQAQQSANTQWQQANNQLQAQTQQAFANGQQQAQQLFNPAQQPPVGGPQPVTAQMPQYPPPQATNTSWNPFATSASSMPPARATPMNQVPRY